MQLEILIFGEHMKKRIYVISGHSGDGKTTWISNAVKYLQDNNFSIAGVYCPASFIDNEKMGIDAVLLPQDKRINLAKFKDNPKDGYSRKWKFDDNAVDEINKHCKNLPDADYLIVDEIGPWELVKGEGFTEATELLKCGKFKKAIVAIRPSMVKRAKSLFYQDCEFKIIDVTENPDLSILQ